MYVMEMTMGTFREHAIKELVYEDNYDDISDIFDELESDKVEVGYQERIIEALTNMKEPKILYNWIIPLFNGDIEINQFAGIVEE